MLDYAEYLESLAARSGAGLGSSRTTAEQGQLTHNKQVEQFLHRAIDRICSRSIISQSYSLHQRRTSPPESLSRLRHQRSAGFHRIFSLAKKNRLISQIRQASAGASAVFCAKARRSRSVPNVQINLSPLDLIHDGEIF